MYIARFDCLWIKHSSVEIYCEIGSVTLSKQWINSPNNQLVAVPALSQNGWGEMVGGRGGAEVGPISKCCVYSFTSS